MVSRNMKQCAGARQYSTPMTYKTTNPMLLAQSIMHWQICHNDLQDSSAEWQPGKQFDASNVLADDDDGVDDEEGDSSQPEPPIGRPSGVKVDVLLAADVARCTMQSAHNASF